MKEYLPFIDTQSAVYQTVCKIVRCSYLLYFSRRIVSDKGCGIWCNCRSVGSESRGQWNATSHLVERHEVLKVLRQKSCIIGIGNPLRWQSLATRKTKRPTLTTKRFETFWETLHDTLHFFRKRKVELQWMSRKASNVPYPKNMVAVMRCDGAVIESTSRQPVTSPRGVAHRATARNGIRGPGQLHQLPWQRAPLTCLKAVILRCPEASNT